MALMPTLRKAPTHILSITYITIPYKDILRIHVIVKCTSQHLRQRTVRFIGLKCTSVVDFVAYVQPLHTSSFLTKSSGFDHAKVPGIA